MSASTESRPFRRYHLPTELVPELTPVPPRFRVRVKRHKLLTLVARELVQTRGDLRVSLSRPCVYGVFSRPVGGMWPREELCVGCLRCTVQYPDMVRVEPNPARARLATDGLTADQVDTLLYEARTGRVPVRGAGYRGRFGGPGWDGMWLDMSEIVRPTRDGIHGRETISTAVEIGGRLPTLAFDAEGRPIEPPPPLRWVELPFLLDGTTLPDPAPVAAILAETAHRAGTLALLPAPAADAAHLASAQARAVIRSGPGAGAATAHPATIAGGAPALVEIDATDPRAREQAAALRERPDEVIIIWRTALGSDLVPLVEAGAEVIHLVAGPEQQLHPQLPRRIRAVHESLVEAGLRDRITLIGSVGVRQADQAAKAIACGLDLVALDLPLWIALQADLRDGAPRFPRGLHLAWGTGRLLNLAASWRDQLLEVLGAMGLREVRRLRGELGRTMFQDELEREAFGDIPGWAPSGFEAADGSVAVGAIGVGAEAQE
jgi:hypothetical protein